MPKNTRPTYRFRGQTPPKPTDRASVLAFAPSSDGGKDGVATLRLLDPIDSWGGMWGVSAKEFAEALDDLPADVHTIELHVNSGGGEVFEAVAIMNMLREHRARVVAYVDGWAASAASFLVASADETIMMPDTQLMIHDAWGLAVGPAEVMRETGQILDRLSDNIASVYAAKAGGSSEDWRAAMLAETWYSAVEAVEAGLADRIWTAPATGDDAKTEDAASAAADLGFKYAGREQAPPPPAIATDQAAAPAPVDTTEETGSQSALETRRRRHSARQRAAKVA